jgi:hypothetical protein
LYTISSLIDPIDTKRTTDHGRVPKSNKASILRASDERESVSEREKTVECGAGVAGWSVDFDRSQIPSGERTHKHSAS